MEQIKDTVLEVFRALDVRRTQGRDNNPEEWLKKILTNKELGHIKVKYFSKGVLGLITDSSTWMHYFDLQKEELQKKLQQLNSQIKEVRIKIGVMQ